VTPVPRDQCKGGEVTDRELTPRELQLVLLIANGYTVRGASEVLGMEYNTGKTHVARILLKLGARNQAHAVGIMCKRGALM
jgi:DNA-binding NarL/FixJ family response regulator